LQESKESSIPRSFILSGVRCRIRIYCRYFSWCCII